MKKFVWLILPILLAAHGSVTGNELFINTDPIGAQVYIGLVEMGETPLRITGFDDDILRLSVSRDGYTPVKQNIEIEITRSQSLYFDLVPQSLDIILSQSGKEVVINDIPTGTAPLLIKNIPNGIYRIENSEESISIKNAEFARMKRAASLETAFTSVMFLASLAGAMSYNQNDNALNFSAILFGGLTGYNLIKLFRLGIEEKKDRLNMSAIEVSPYNREEDREIFTDGVDLIGKEMWSDALARFNLLINVYPSSSFVPLSIYEIGYCFYNLGDIQTASQYFQRYVTEYPAVEFYPYALLYLMESYLVLGQYERALAEYKSLRPLYLNDPSGELHGDFSVVLTRLYRGTNRRHTFLIEDLVREIDHFLEENPGSAMAGEMVQLRRRVATMLPGGTAADEGEPDAEQ